MSKYLLYGETLIENDDTLKDFVISLVKRCPIDNIDDKDEFIDLINEMLLDDISRTEIDYEELLYKYRHELGDLLYEMDNHGVPMRTLNFFGDEAQSSFEYIVNEYLDIYYSELIQNLN